MGNDITFLTSPNDGDALTWEEYEQQTILAFRDSVALLFLLCFRHYDLKLMLDGPCNIRSRENFTPVIHYVVPFDLAIKQLHAGIKVIKKQFRSAANIDPYVEYFVDFLMSGKDNYLHMNCVEYANAMPFDLMLHHALLGIQYPDMKMYYSPDQNEHFSSNGDSLPSDGIITWCGALRRITNICKPDESFDQDELFTSKDLEDFDELHLMGICRL